MIRRVLVGLSWGHWSEQLRETIKKSHSRVNLRSCESQFGGYEAAVLACF